MRDLVFKIFDAISTDATKDDLFEHFFQHEAALLNYVESRLAMPEDVTAPFHRNFEAAMKHYGALIPPAAANEISTHLTAAGFYLGMIRSVVRNPETANQAYMLICGAIFPLYKPPTTQDEMRRRQ